MRRIKADVVENLNKKVVPRLEAVDDPNEFKGAPKSKRDRASQLVQHYGKHST